MLGNEKDYLATRTSYKLNLRGPSLNIQTACSTSLVAVAQAYQSLQGYQCDMAIAGGISVTARKSAVICITKAPLSLQTDIAAHSTRKQEAQFFPTASASCC